MLRFVSSRSTSSFTNFGTFSRGVHFSQCVLLFLSLFSLLMHAPLSTHSTNPLGTLTPRHPFLSRSRFPLSCPFSGGLVLFFYLPLWCKRLKMKDAIGENGPLPPVPRPKLAGGAKSGKSKMELGSHHCSGRRAAAFSLF